MASRALPDSGVHPSPVRQNVAARWLNNVAPAASASKTVRWPVKKWPSHLQVEAPPHFPVAAAPGPTPAGEKRAAASAFQSARAMFETKKAPAAAAAPPSSRLRVASPIVVAKQDSNSSDLSSSSCSTVDSETDRKLEECVETQKPKPSPPVHVLENMEKESVEDSPPVQASAKIASDIAKNLVSPPARESQALRSPSPASIGFTTDQVKQIRPMHDEIDPFRLLLPVNTLPALPDEVPSVYDGAAIEMEKNIKKVVRKLLKKDKARLEEFKMNSRLFGTDFMDSHAYLDTLIKDLGQIRALQLVPCLLSVQPDILKGNALLLCAKNYLLRNEDALRQELRELQVASAMTTRRRIAASDVVSAATTLPAKNTPAATEATTKAQLSRVPPSPSETEREASPNPVPARRACSASEAQRANAAVENIGSPIAQSLTSTAPPSPVNISTNRKSTVQCLAATKTTATKPVEPMPEPQEAAPPVINLAVAGTIQQVVDPNPVVTKRAESATPTDSEEEFRVENLFGEIIKPSPPKNQPHKQSETNAVVAPISPTSSIQSFEEAENLFGERLSPSSRSSVSRRKTVTWGETQTVGAPTQKDAPAKTTMKPLPFLFGPATAAAFDSDSDESDFSD